MMRSFITVFVILSFCSSFAQAQLVWDSEYRITIEDFQSPQTEISDKVSSYLISSATSVEFGYQMSTYEYMFTKNFNSKVKTIMNRGAAVIVAPDAETANKLVLYGQYSFDLDELYSRKLRKEIYEKKGTFSEPSFIQVIFNDLQIEIQSENARVSKLTELGMKEEILQLEIQKVRDQIDELSDYCFECKPPKKKK